MRRATGWILAAALVAAVAAGAYAYAHRATDAAGSAPRAEPVARVSTGLATVRELADTLTAYGEVSVGPLAGLSFARPGQLTRLAVLPGDRVARGQLLARLALDPGARETWQQAVNALALARREADRLHQLLGLQLATRSQVDAADKGALNAAGAVQALQAQGGGASVGTLTAPFDGVVAAVPVAQGDRLAAGATVLQLARADSLRVQLGIEPDQSRRLRAGMTATLWPLATTDAAPAPVVATVASVQDVVDPKTQLVSAIVTLPRAAAQALVPGMKVRASLSLGTRQWLAVPRDAVLRDAKGGYYLYQVVGGRARRTTVTRQLEADGYVAIDGLADTRAPVVTLGNYELQDGMAVRQAGEPTQ